MERSELMLSKDIRFGWGGGTQLLEQLIRLAMSIGVRVEVGVQNIFTIESGEMRVLIGIGIHSSIGI